MTHKQSNTDQNAQWKHTGKNVLSKLLPQTPRGWFLAMTHKHSNWQVNAKQTRRANAQMTHIQVQNWRKCVSYVPKAHTSHTKHMVHDAFNVCSNHALFKLQWTRIFKKKFFKNCSLWFWHICNLKKDWGCQTWYELVDLEQNYNHAKFERTCLNSVH